MKKATINKSSRRSFIKQSAALAAASVLLQSPGGRILAATVKPKKKVNVNAHLWVYASKYPPYWDSTPDLETVFSDLSAAGLHGVELMEINLKHDDAVKNLNALRQKYHLAVSGTSYGTKAKMWLTEDHNKILDEVKLCVTRLSQVNGKTFGISVGDAGRLKTEGELDNQASILKNIFTVCKDYGVEPNLHNHTYEVNNGMHDLKGTMQRIPDVKLGPDLNWLMRAGIDPVEFINTYADNIVYMHLRDQYADGTWTEYLGQGVTDFPAIAKALQATRFKGDSVAIELAFPDNYKPVNTLKTDWQISRNYVKKTFNW